MSSVDTKIVPVLREGVTVVQMILFKKLKETLPKRYSDRDNIFINRLTGAIINRIFCIENLEKTFVDFATENKTVIERELANFPLEYKELCIPLTDALRVQFLCDNQDGLDSKAILENANKLGILDIERDIPLPRNFLDLVRTLGKSLNIIIPPVFDEEDDLKQ
ncbi:MAG: hypothetical protein K9L30_09500 [Desulfobacterales bacterium]|nr:hypothetical protein [Desulfobacterales bacterium]